MNSHSVPNNIAEIDLLELLVVMDNETDTLSSVDEGVPQSPEVAHLAARTPTSRLYEGRECKTVFDRLCCGSHGLSVLVTGRLHDVEHTVLFDVGPYPQYWLDNAERLNVDLRKIECLFLSDWHFDHSGGFPEIIAASQSPGARGSNSTSVPSGRSVGSSSTSRPSWTCALIVILMGIAFDVAANKMNSALPLYTPLLHLPL